MNAESPKIIYTVFGQFEPLAVGRVVVIQETDGRWQVEPSPATYHRDWLWKDDPEVFESYSDANRHCLDGNERRLIEARSRVKVLEASISDQKARASSPTEVEQK